MLIIDCMTGKVTSTAAVQLQVSLEAAGDGFATTRRCTPLTQASVSAVQQRSITCIVLCRQRDFYSSSGGAGAEAASGILPAPSGSAAPVP